MFRQASPRPARVAAYSANRIRRHEHTRPDKELDRTRQIEAVGAHTGPVLTVHAPDTRDRRLLEQAPRANRSPMRYRRRHPPSGLAACRCRDYRCDYHAFRGDAGDLDRRRPSSLGRGGARRRSARERGETAPIAFCWSAFPTDQVRILAYNRVVRDLNGLSRGRIPAAARDTPSVTPAAEPVRPERRGRFGMFLGAPLVPAGAARPPARRRLARRSPRCQPAQRSAAGAAPRHRRPPHRPAHRFRRRRARSRRSRSAFAPAIGPSPSPFIPPGSPI